MILHMDSWTQRWLLLYLHLPNLMSMSSLSKGLIIFTKHFLNTSQCHPLQWLSSISRVNIKLNHVNLCGASGKGPACQCRRHKRHGFDTWVGKILRKRKWQPSPVFLPGKSHGQTSLAGYSKLSCKELDTTEAAEYIMRNAGLEEPQARIKIAGRNINNLI